MMDERYRFNARKLSGKEKHSTGLLQGMAPDGPFGAVRTDSGRLTVKRNMGEGTYRHIHSTVDPGKEARIWNDCQSVGTGSTVILGCGLGYHVLEFLKRHVEVKHIYLVEADASLFHMAQEITDAPHGIEDPRIHFLVGQDLKPVEETLCCALVAGSSYHVFLPATGLYPQFYGDVIRILDEQLFRVRSGAGRSGSCSIADSGAAGVRELIDVMKRT